MSGKTTRAAWTTGLCTIVLAAGLITTGSAGAVTGGASTGAGFAFAAKLAIGNHDRSCTGALVGTDWVVSAASCFADDSEQPATLTAGKPKLKTMATVGRADFSTAGGQVQEVIELVPYKGRDIVMARLAKPVTGITPLTVASTAPAPGETVTVAGYGRTKTEWVPNKLHTSEFIVDAVDGTSLRTSGRTAGDAICKGDAGGPLLRPKGTSYELIAINSRSWQGGCLGVDATESRNNAIQDRADDIARWIELVRDRDRYPNVNPDPATGKATTFRGGAGNPASVLHANGTMETYVVGADGSVTVRYEEGANGPWSGTKSVLGPNSANEVIAAVDDTGRPNIFMVQTNGGILRRYTDGTWSDWGRFADVGSARSAKVARDQLGRLNVFMLQTNGGILRRYETKPAGAWSDWERFADAGWANDIQIGAHADGRLSVFMAQTNGGIKEKTESSPGKAWEEWSTFADAKDMSTEAPKRHTSQLATANEQDGRLVVMMRQSNGGVVQRSEQKANGAWAGWARTAEAGSADSLALARQPNGRLSLFLLTAGRTITQRTQTAANGAWSAPVSFSATQETTHLSVAAHTNGILSVFATRADGTVTERRQTAPNGSWYPWSTFTSAGSQQP